MPRKCPASKAVYIRRTKSGRKKLCLSKKCKNGLARKVGGYCRKKSKKN